MKKSLSIIIMVMVLLSLIPAVAADTEESSSDMGTAGISRYTDEEQIQNREAVAVLTGLGVINGMEDASFQPQSTLTRAQTAKLISVFVNHGNLPDTPAFSGMVFTDVPADHWASGCILFGTEQGYINGMGDGTFLPEGNVTASQMASILTKIIGYVPEDVNSLWPDCVMSTAEQAGLFAGIEKKAEEALDREEAAQMMFNALKADRKVLQTSNTFPETGQFVYQTLQGPVLTDYLLRGDNSYEQLIESLFPGVTCIYEPVDALGHQKVVWRDRNAWILNEALEQPSYVYTSKKTSTEIRADLGEYSFRNTDVILNGCRIPASYGFLQSCEDLSAKLTGNGIPVEVYTDEQNREIARVIAVRYYLKTVSQVDAEAGTVTIGHGNSRVTLGKNDTGFSSVAPASKGDAVLVAPACRFRDRQSGSLPEENWSYLTDACMPDLVTGGITGIITPKDSKSDEGSVIIGGETFLPAAGLDLESLRVDKNQNGIAYLDRYGYLEGYNDNADTDPADWVYVKSMYRKTDDSDGSPTWCLRGVTEDGVLKDFPVIDLKNIEPAADSRRITSPGFYSKRICEWIQQYQNRIAFPTDDRSSTSEEIVLSEDSVFFYEGKAVCGRESAGGWYFFSEDRDWNGSSLGWCSVTKDNLPGEPDYIGGIRFADHVKIISIGGNDLNRLSVTVSEGVTNPPSGSVCIIKKITENSLRVTSVFTEKESYQAETKKSLIRVTGITGESSYEDSSGEMKNDGVMVTYYGPDSAEEKTMVVAAPESGNLRNGWYTALTENGDAYILDGYVPDSTSVRRDSTTKSAVGGYYTGRIVSGYNGLIQTAGELSEISFQFSGDDAVRDPAGSGIHSVEALVSAVSSGDFRYKVVFAFTVKNDQYIITQLYIIR